LLGQPGAASGCLRCSGQIPPQPLVLRSAERQLEIAEHSGQEILEVVGDPAGHLADRLHLLRLPECLLGALPLGYFSA
jgi:hypothetical protein